MRDWASTPHQPLPRPVAPILDETLGSYLRRLAAANRLDPTALRVHLTASPRTSAPIPVDVLTLLSGQRSQALRYAILELNTSEELAEMNVGHRPRPAGIARARCRLCLRARGCRETVWCWSRPEDVLCHRHRRWIANDEDHGYRQQPSLRDQPEILAAHRRHHKLIRRYGRSATTTAFQHADAVCRKWHEHGQHDQQCHRRLTGFHGHGWRVLVCDPTVAAARYPQTVELTTLLVNPSWISYIRRNWPEPTDFTAAIRQRVAPHFGWSVITHYGRLDPLVALIIDLLQPNAGAFHRHLLRVAFRPDNSTTWDDPDTICPS
jgi:hypothetical protein